VNYRAATDVEIRQDRIKLGNPYAHLGHDGQMSALKAEVSAPAPLKRYSENRIEKIVTEIQLGLWNDRARLWPHDSVCTPVDILDPQIALQEQGFSVEGVESLGEILENGELFEVAGLIDPINRVVKIGNRFPLEVRNFTTAHELAHAVLHVDSLTMHRDRPISGNTPRRLLVEREADLFASFFLMPQKQVISEFVARFGPAPLCLNEQSSFNLGIKEPFTNLSKRDLSRILAKSSFFGYPIESLSKRFKVSTEAMAIRLEQLELC